MQKRPEKKIRLQFATNIWESYIKKTSEFEKALIHLEKHHKVEKEIYNHEAENKIRNLEIIEKAKFSQREKEVKEASESQFQVLFEESPISIWELDWSKLKVHIDELKSVGVEDFDAYFVEHPDEIYTWVALIEAINVNTSTVNLFKANSKESLLKEFQPLIHKEAVPRVQSIYAKFAQGELAAGARLLTHNFAGEELYTKNLFTIAQGHEDNWGRVLLSVIDVTEEEIGKQTINDSEELYRSVSEMANDGICIVDQGVITYCNESFANILGREIKEVVGKTFISFLHPDTHEDIRRHYQDLLEGDDIEPIKEFTVVKKDKKVTTNEGQR